MQSYIERDLSHITCILSCVEIYCWIDEKWKVVKCTISVLSWAEVKIGKVWIDCYIKQQAGSSLNIA